MKHKLFVMALSLILLLVLAPPALAQGPGGDNRVVFGNNFTLAAEQTVEGDVVVFGGNATVEKSSTIKGDLAVFGGNINIDGAVEGDIAAIGGNVNLGETAVVKGDIALLGGKSNVAAGAVVEGSIVRPFDGGFTHDFRFPEPPAPPTPPVPPQPPWAEPWSWANRLVNMFQDLAWTMAMLIGLAAVSWLVATFMPAQMKQVGDTVADSGPLSFGLGLVTVIVSIAIGIPLFITICLAFIPILVYILIGIAILFGWIVIGQMIGERLLVATGQPYPNFVFSTIAGVLVLTVVSKMPVIGSIPCLGFIFSFIGFLVGTIVSLTGLGAVILTRFGTRPYTRSSYAGSTGPRPASSNPYQSGPTYSDEDLADLNINSASEAELKAKIKAALAEAAQAEPEPKEPAQPASDEEPPADEPNDKA